MINCSRITPYSEDFIKGLIPVERAVFVGFFLIAVITCGIFIELWVYLHKNISCQIIKDKTLMVLGLFPVISIACQLGTTVPRAATLVDLVIAVYTGISLFGFFHLTVAYLGGQNELLDKLQFLETPMSVGPCCCCCLCLPKLKITKKVYTVLRVSISQTMILLPVLQFINAVLWADGKYYKEALNVHNPLFYIGILMTISTLTSLYVFNLLMRGSFQIAERTLNLVPKYAMIILCMVITTLQPLIIETLTGYNVIPCWSSFYWEGRASEIDHMLKILEMFILMLVSRWYYRKPTPVLPMSFENSLQETPCMAE
ncbi:organic solute transporter subunit alpha-like [Erpetoichthys calabaricus]|uniref:organic solute transporter subunit alpha-like n=1 Tax=Erpetoichthys calabaricus TaxID=27687 RepID=UPI00223427E8|nr:organic solute transporter subunit alpha-like [Erpetoichthys calabaricus]